jgi:hypothetical protein
MHGSRDLPNSQLTHGSRKKLRYDHRHWTTSAGMQTCTAEWNEPGDGMGIFVQADSRNLVGRDLFHNFRSPEANSVSLGASDSVPSFPFISNSQQSSNEKKK